MSRRSNGEGSIRKRNGKWICEVMQGYRADGRRNIIYLHGKTKKEVLAQYQKMRRDQEDGLDTSANYTFGEWADIWYDSHKDNISQTTAQSYAYTLRRLKDACFASSSACFSSSSACLRIIIACSFSCRNCSTWYCRISSGTSKSLMQVIPVLAAQRQSLLAARLNWHFSQSSRLAKYCSW